MVVFVFLVISLVIEKPQDLLGLTWLLLLLQLACVVVLVQGLPSSEVETCDTGYYLNSTDKCVLCSTCAEGQGLLHPCMSKMDTVCETCSRGYFSRYISNNSFCTQCTNCSALNRIEETACTQLQDSVCGQCSKAHFLKVNHDGSTQCEQCSYCPPDKEVIRWYDCTDLPDNQQCAPGYTEPHTTQLPTSTVETDSLWDIVRLTNRSGFVSIPDQSQSDTADSSLEILISVVSLLFTIATLSVFVCAMVCFLNRICKRRQSRHRVRIAAISLS